MSSEDTPIPTYIELMRPTLQAIHDLGGEGSSVAIDEKTIEVSELTVEQVAVEFGPEQTQKGSKVRHRLAWARTYLKKGGLIENRERGHWALLPAGQDVLDLDPHEADEVLTEMDRDVRRGASDLADSPVRRAGDPTYEPTYQAAAQWRDTSLRTGSSLFEPEQLAWSSDVVAELRRRVIENFDDSARSFGDKLADQLAGASQEVHLLASEILYVHLLALSNVTAERGSRRWGM